MRIYVGKVIDSFLSMKHVHGQTFCRCSAAIFLPIHLSQTTWPSPASPEVELQQKQVNIQSVGDLKCSDRPNKTNNSHVMAAMMTTRVEHAHERTQKGVDRRV